MAARLDGVAVIETPSKRAVLRIGGKHGDYSVQVTTKSLPLLNLSSKKPATRLITQAMRSIRIERRLRASDVAREMNLPLRTYERLEAGTGPLTYDRILSFATATNSDPIALFAVLPLDNSDFASWCADNKLMTIIMMVVGELAEELGADIGYLEARTLIGIFTRASREVIDNFRARDTFAETWLNDRKDRLSRVTPLPNLFKRRQVS